MSDDKREPCPSCDHDLSYPGQEGHDCYTYAEWRERQQQRTGRERCMIFRPA